ncbi:hypothetical protein [Nitrospira sp. Kam-Ns4a]
MVPALLLAVLAVLAMLVPEAVILGATPLVAFGCVMLGGALTLLMEAGGAHDTQPGLLEETSG